MANGAISQRFEDAQAWSDFVYMVPPFLAYAGVVQDNLSLTIQAYTQVKLYRDILRNSTTNLWYHILEGPFSDARFFGTGNAWVLAGILRVYATLLHSQFADQLGSELADLAVWGNELISGTFPFVNVSVAFNATAIPITPQLR